MQVKHDGLHWIITQEVKESFLPTDFAGALRLGGDP
jgi:hypothetical protein